jgi:hypothetical protein
MKIGKLLIAGLLTLSLANAQDVMQKSMSMMEEGMTQIQQGFLNNNVKLIENGAKLVKGDFMDIIGQFPLFYFPEYGSAWMMGVTGTIHILASHTSVGAAMLLHFWLTKHIKKIDDLYPYMKKYGMFLLIFSYVIGSITGPGIWYTATAASPRGISALIHNFVWVWATEWVFFVYEVIGVFVLVYFMIKSIKKHTLKLTLPLPLLRLVPWHLLLVLSVL